MTLLHDMCDCWGGLPFEVAAPDAIVDFYAARGFVPLTINRCGRRHRCSEFVFQRRPRPNAA